MIKAASKNNSDNQGGTTDQVKFDNVLYKLQFTFYYIRRTIFFNCTGLTSVNIPDGVVSIGLSAFENCQSLTNAEIPESVTEIGLWAFNKCQDLTASYKGKTYDYKHINDLYKAINGN
ncbi:MAG: leucine-rich repeat protein [Oscillospiraceae bacterium]|nr:leucine-rich repeat protein [Oscillospiraceae bacterium]